MKKENTSILKVPLELKAYQKKYLAFYSSYFDQVITDPRWMLIPIDDHGFHRGDGVFEALKWKNNKLWLLDKHLERLKNSSDKLGIKIPISLEKLTQRLHELMNVSEKPEGLLRVFITRGPGNFGVNPYDTVGSQVYIVATELKEITDEEAQKGVRIMWSQVTPKESFWATTKSLNYLPNVMMKKEAVDFGYDYAIGIDSHNYITEGSTENIAIIKENVFYHPPFESILKGTTLLKVIELIKFHNVLLKIEEKKISTFDVIGADEVLMIGTTIDVLPVKQVNENSMKIGPKFFEIRKILINDQKD